VKIPVTVTTAAEQEIKGAFTLPAVVKAENQANITLNSAGKIQNLNFRLGSYVTKGQVLGSLDNSLRYISLEAAQLALDKAKVDYDRVKALYEGKAATEVDFNNTKFNYENLKTQVAQIKQQIADANIIAPITGT